LSRSPSAVAAIFCALRLRAAALAERIIKLVEAGQMDELVRSRHCVGGSNFHLQLTPKYRKPIFWERPVRKLVEAVIRMKIFALGLVLEAIEFGPDHVHLFVTNCRKYDVPTMIQHIKGFSSWYLRKNYWDLFKNQLWGDSFWTDGYFFESIGRITSENVKFYIMRQQGKHWMHAIPETLKDTGRRLKTEQCRLDAFGG
jgi:putative transposase